MQKRNEMKSLGQKVFIKISQDIEMSKLQHCGSALYDLLTEKLLNNEH